VGFRFVEAERAQFPVSLLCKTVGVTRGGGRFADEILDDLGCRLDVANDERQAGQLSRPGENGILDAEVATQGGTQILDHASIMAYAAWTTDRCETRAAPTHFHRTSSGGGSPRSRVRHRRRRLGGHGFATDPEH
jgi:hypothetical protein